MFPLIIACTRDLEHVLSFSSRPDQILSKLTFDVTCVKSWNGSIQKFDPDFAIFFFHHLKNKTVTENNAHESTA